MQIMSGRQTCIDCKAWQKGDPDTFLDHRDQCWQTGCRKRCVLFQRNARHARQRVFLQAVTALKQQQTTPGQIRPLDPRKIGQQMRAGGRKAVVVLEQRQSVHLWWQIMGQSDQDQVQTPIRQTCQGMSRSLLKLA